MRRLTLIDLFAGCGGMTLGFTQTGRYEPIQAVEFDADAAETYERNFGSHIERDSDGVPLGIEAVEKFRSADVVIGGPPCQGFSPLNMTGVGLERRSLWREYFRCLVEAEPRAFVMENVPQLLKSAEYVAFKTKVEMELGYSVEENILNAADYGVPQTRRRAIVIGVAEGKPIWPARTHFPPEEAPTEGDAWKTFRDAVTRPTRLPGVPDGRNWHNPRNPKPISLQRYAAIPNEGENRFDLAERAPEITPACWLRKPTGSTDVFGRLWWNRPAFTIRTEFFKPEKGRYLHPEEHRPITVREAARCMSFPDNFVFPESQSMTSVGKQIGNAVPPLLAAAVAQAVADHLEQAPSEQRTLELAA